MLFLSVTLTQSCHFVSCRTNYRSSYSGQEQWIVLPQKHSFCSHFSQSKVCQLKKALSGFCAVWTRWLVNRLQWLWQFFQIDALHHLKCLSNHVSTYVPLWALLIRKSCYLVMILPQMPPTKCKLPGNHMLHSKKSEAKKVKVLCNLKGNNI